jgi:hypothetical protein
VLGAWWEGRPGAVWLEGMRVLALAVVPALVGGWFGLHGEAVVAAFATVFGGSALALAWVARDAVPVREANVARHA